MWVCQFAPFRVLTAEGSKLLQKHGPYVAQQRQYQIADALTSLGARNKADHWLHDHSAEAVQLLSLYGLLGKAQELTEVSKALFADVRTCASCVVAYHAAKVPDSSLQYRPTILNSIIDIYKATKAAFLNDTCSEMCSLDRHY